MKKFLALLVLCVVLISANQAMACKKSAHPDKDTTTVSQATDAAGTPSGHHHDAEPSHHHDNNPEHHHDADPSHHHDADPAAHHDADPSHHHDADPSHHHDADPSHHHD